MTNEQGIEVSTSIHGTPVSRRSKFGDNNVENNRMSNGCINGKCQDLKDLYSKYKVQSGTNIYILPEENGNRFEQQDGKMVLKVNAKNREKALNYVDSKGVSQKGQGVNQSINTLQYKPIKAFINKTEFEKDVYQWNDANDDEEYNKTTKPYMQSLVSNKQAVMKAAKISSDTYNEIAKISFGIYGTESNYGDTHSAIGNFSRAGAKFLNNKGSSSPDYKAKATTYGADENNRSVGLTQIRFSYLNEDEKKALKEVGITSNQDFMNPEKAAKGTAIVLGIRYNQQLTDDQKKDIWKHLPTKWNTRGNYAERVKNNSKYLSIKQLE
jgi:lipoprotein-anchoring transpeptidase ErfK/SrfK